MELPKNGFKAALAEGRRQIGVWCQIPGGGHAEALARCGFDWMMIDTEHSATDLTMVQTMLQAAAPWPTHSVVRPGWNDAVEIKRLLDLGARNLLIPYVQSAEEARRAVAAVRYPPEGTRGVAGLTRASGFGLIKDYTARANAEICLLVQVETAAALEEIEAIAAVDGVDGVFIGPADLGASMGFPGQGGRAEVKAAVRDGIRRIKAAGKPPGVLSLDQPFLRELQEDGAVFTAVDVDTAILMNGARARAKEWQG
ncbi:MAG: aldolase/citrate lyase family protein [Paracoccaceae bacterium]